MDIIKKETGIYLGHIWHEKYQLLQLIAERKSQGKMILENDTHPNRKILFSYLDKKETYFC